MYASKNARTLPKSNSISSSLSAICAMFSEDFCSSGMRGCFYIYSDSEEQEVEGCRAGEGGGGAGELQGEATAAGEQEEREVEVGDLKGGEGGGGAAGKVTATATAAGEKVGEEEVRVGLLGGGDRGLGAAARLYRPDSRLLSSVHAEPDHAISTCIKCHDKCIRIDR